MGRYVSEITMCYLSLQHLVVLRGWTCASYMMRTMGCTHRHMLLMGENSVLHNILYVRLLTLDIYPILHPYAILSISYTCNLAGCINMNVESWRIMIHRTHRIGMPDTEHTRNNRCICVCVCECVVCYIYDCVWLCASAHRQTQWPTRTTCNKRSMHIITLTTISTALTVFWVVMNLDEP